MKAEHSKLYVIVVLAGVAVFGVLYVAKGALLEYAYRQEIAAQEYDYLTALRNGDLGCRTVFARRPDVLVIGDSHAYAGWDFLTLQQMLGKRVGACAMGGAYIDSLPDLVSKILPLKPEHIIISVSPRMFWDSKTRVQQATTNDDMIAGLNKGLGGVRELFDLENFDGRHGEDIQRRNAHEPAISSLDEKKVHRALNVSVNQDSLSAWHERLKQVNHRAADGGEAIRQLCSLAQRNGLSYSVVYMPESPFLEGLYAPWLWNAFVDGMQGFNVCAEHVVVQRSLDYGLGNRHFVNRYLDDSVSYEPFVNGTEVSDQKAFDADHMNPFGATLFTRKIVSLIQGAP